MTQTHMAESPFPCASSLLLSDSNLLKAEASWQLLTTSPCLPCTRSAVPPAECRQRERSEQVERLTLVFLDYAQGICLPFQPVFGICNLRCNIASCPSIGSVKNHKKETKGKSYPSFSNEEIWSC